MKYYLIGLVLLISASVASADNHESGVRDGSKPFVLIARMQSKLDSVNDVV